MNRPDYSKKLYFSLLVFSIIIATVISSSFSRDSVGYNEYIVRYGATGWSELSKEVFNLEGLFVLLSKVIYSLNLDHVFLFLFYASVSLSIKFYLIYKYSPDKILSLAFFISYFFILHDSTQIRFSIAVAFVYLGLHCLAANRKLLFSLIVVFSTFMFHTAISVFIVLLFFRSSKSTVWVLGMLLIALLLYPLNLNSIMLDLVKNAVYYLDFERAKILYRVMLEPSSDIFLGMFRPVALLVYFCTVVAYQYRSKFNTYETLCYNALLLSIFCYVLLKDIPDLQVRFSDMFGFSLVFLVPYVHRGLSEYIGVKYAYIILYSFFSIHLVKYTLYDKMLIL